MLLQAKQLTNRQLFYSKWQLWPFWVKWISFCAFARLVTTFIFFSAWDESRVKWDNAQNSTQKMRTLVLPCSKEARSQLWNLTVVDQILYFYLFTYWILISLNLGTSFYSPCHCCSCSTSYSNSGWVLHVYCLMITVFCFVNDFISFVS